MPTPPARRLLRGTAAASVATFLALVSHVAGGGTPPAWSGVAVPLAVSVVVCVALAGRSLSLARLSVSVAASQVLFHLLFVVGADPHAAHHHHGPPVLHEHHHQHHHALGTSAAVVEPHLHGGPSMWLWHGAAAVITVAALYRGEAALVGLRRLAAAFAAWLRHRLHVLDLRPPHAPDVRLPRGYGDRVLLPPGYFPSACRRRGPPPLGVV
ncbi:hypothetical protein [Actinoalloteichus caeruleus]|uniref:Integral membrane protein n=1 Tax=Actinoalloteichus caeruleus DSM 43889 TaxID=1120930 RepID=A0ABT1JLD9_ACTCY|nr:hypothetical protein [Actinoalloteichus caeruleus]MCP2333109.1 hypothetical protein [Actinoalloteichus caeruleus DSM 43889]